jgi:thioredoxin-dependent peroxiredoxin
MKTLAAVAALLLASTGASAAMLAPGQPFPAWSLRDDAGHIVSSADLAGKTYLLWFFPKAMTSGCTKEGCTLRDNFTGFEKAGVTLLGVSFDPPASNAKFVATYHFPFRLLSDSDHKLAVAVGAADSTSRPWARRISYLVGPDGKVIKAYDHVQPAEHAGQVLADLAAMAKRR